MKKTNKSSNFWILVTEGAFFFFGLAFLNANSVVSVFIEEYTGSLKLAGLASTITMTAHVVAQFFIGPFMGKIKHYKKFATRTMLIFRPLMLLMIPALIIIDNPLISVYVFLFSLTLLWVSDGFVVLPWNNILARTIKPENRGLLLGNQQIFGNILGLLAGIIIKITLQSPLENDYKYSIIFGMAGIVLFISAISMIFSEEVENKNVNKEKVSFSKYYKNLPKLFFKNKKFLHMLYIKIASSFVIAVLPFVILFGKKEFNLNVETVSTLVFLQIVGALAGGFLWGKISEKYGNKEVILATAISSTLVPILGLLSLPTGSMPLIYAMSVIGGISTLQWIGFVNYTIDVVKPKNISDYFIITAIVGFPLGFLSYLAGHVAESLGFTFLFTAALPFGLISIILSLTIKRASHREDTK